MLLAAHIFGIPVEENLPGIAAVGGAWLVILPALVRRHADRWRRLVRGTAVRRQQPRRRPPPTAERGPASGPEPPAGARS